MSLHPFLTRVLLLTVTWSLPLHASAEAPAVRVFTKNKNQVLSGPVTTASKRAPLPLAEGRVRGCGGNGSALTFPEQPTLTFDVAVPVKELVWRFEGASTGGGGVFIAGPLATDGTPLESALYACSPLSTSAAAFLKERALVLPGRYVLYAGFPQDKAGVDGTLLVREVKTPEPPTLGIQAPPEGAAAGARTLARYAPSFAKSRAKRETLGEMFVAVPTSLVLFTIADLDADSAVLPRYADLYPETKKRIGTLVYPKANEPVLLLDFKGDKARIGTLDGAVFLTDKDLLTTKKPDVIAYPAEVRMPMLETYLAGEDFQYLRESDEGFIGEALLAKVDANVAEGRSLEACWRAEFDRLGGGLNLARVTRMNGQVVDVEDNKLVARKKADKKCKMEGYRARSAALTKELVGGWQKRHTERLKALKERLAAAP